MGIDLDYVNGICCEILLNWENTILNRIIQVEQCKVLRSKGDVFGACTIFPNMVLPVNT